jgi:hypothetical protein
MDEKPSEIKDIQSAKNLKEQTAQVDAVRKALPFFELLGVDTAKLEPHFQKFDEAAKETEKYHILSDPFNELFSSRGWIAHELLPAKVMEQAIEKAANSNIDEAEQDLIDYYSDKIGVFITLMKGIKAFRSRITLARKAKEDYEAQRYHACVPVILMLLDGLISELSKNHRGFFAEQSDLEAWDSISAHSKGLGLLSKTLGITRTKTNTDPITIPYRHGILHGHDLNYGSKIVAAKAWAALFSVRDLALKIERGEKDAPPLEESKPEPSLLEVLEQIRESYETTEKWKSWQPRKLQLGLDFLQTGEPKDFLEGSPERKCVEFLFYWTKQNYFEMAKCLWNPSQLSHKKMAGELRTRYDNERLIQFEIFDVRDVSQDFTELKVKCCFETSSETKQKNLLFKVHNRDENNKMAIWGQSGSEWFLMTYPSPY